MKYEVSLCGEDRASADKLYKMGLDMGIEVKVEPEEDKPEDYKDSKDSKKGVLGMVSE